MLDLVLLVGHGGGGVVERGDVQLARVTGLVDRVDQLGQFARVAALVRDRRAWEVAAGVHRDEVDARGDELLDVVEPELGVPTGVRLVHRQVVDRVPLVGVGAAGQGVGLEAEGDPHRPGVGRGAVGEHHAAVVHDRGLRRRSGDGMARAAQQLERGQAGAGERGHEQQRTSSQLHGCSLISPGRGRRPGRFPRSTALRMNRARSFAETHVPPARRRAGETQIRINAEESQH
jgi:hypothetical protein